MKKLLCPLAFAIGLIAGPTLPSLVAVESTSEVKKPTRSRAFYNPKVSSRDIAMNQAISVSFTTLRPQIEEVSPLAIVEGALAQNDTAANWRVLTKPVIVDNDKIGTLNISFSLLPRVSGEVPLPEIPVRWLRGNQIATFGSAQVAALLARGTVTKPLAADHESIGGYAWGTSYQEILQRTGLESGTLDASGDLVVTTKAGLELIIRGSRLAAARIYAKGVNVAQARQAFLDRWGDNQASDDPLLTRWIIGWVRIEARTKGIDQTVIELTHEGIEADIARQQIEDKVFDLLDGNGTAVTDNPTPSTPQPTPEPKPERPESEQASPDSVDAIPPAEPVQRPLDVEAEFERQLERAQNTPVE